MNNLPAQVLAIVRSECSWIGRYPPVPPLTEESDLDPRWFTPVDRCCVAVEISDQYQAEVPGDEIEAWTSVADIIASVKRLVGAPA